MFRTPVRQVADGAYALTLDAEERTMIRRLAAELRTLVEADDPMVARLFPPAFRDDAEAAAEFDRLVREGLVSGRVAALTTVERTAESERLDHEQLEAWCGALNDMRLVIGEKVGVTEDLYGWLSWLQSEVVEVLTRRLS